MKTLTYIIAVLCFLLAVFTWSIVGRFTAMYEEVGADLPSVTRALVGAWSFLPSGILGVIGIYVITAAIRKSSRSVLIVAVVAMICGMAVVFITALILCLPLRQLSDDGVEEVSENSGRTSRCIRPLTVSLFTPLIAIDRSRCVTFDPPAVELYVR